MKLFEISLRPSSPFGTPLKGDTVFGHFCWQAAYDPSLLEGGLESRLKIYAEKPFAVFSSAFPKVGAQKPAYALIRPELPSHPTEVDRTDRKDRMLEAKEQKRKKWMLVDGTLKIKADTSKYLSEETLCRLLQESSGQRSVPATVSETAVLIAHAQPHNSINRLTQTTGAGGMFAPYIKENTFYYPGIELALFVLVDTEATGIDRLVTGIARIGQWGYGRDASTGMGRFEVTGQRELETPALAEAKACYTLAPTVLDQAVFEKIYFKPFVRFGKHGDSLARGANPFKTPVVMADEGAVVCLGKKGSFDKPYIGRAVNGVSKVRPEAVVQGYAPILPIKLEQ